MHKLGGIPKYVLVESLLREELRDMTPGDQLPAEGTLARKFQVSRVTLQRALNALAEEGLITRHQGRGTFFAGMADKEELQTLSGALDSLMHYESDARARILDITRSASVSPRIRRILQVNEGDVVFVLRRVLVSKKRPFIYLVNYLPARIGELLSHDRKELERYPVVSLLRDKYDIKLARAAQTIEAVLANPELSGYLEVAIGSPLLLAERVYFQEDEEVAQMTQLWYRSDQYKYRIILSDWTGPRWHPAGGGGQARGREVSVK